MRSVSTIFGLNPSPMTIPWIGAPLSKATVYVSTSAAPEKSGSVARGMVREIERSTLIAG